MMAALRDPRMLTDEQWERHKAGEFRWAWTGTEYEAVAPDGQRGTAQSLPDAVDALDRAQR